MIKIILERLVITNFKGIKSLTIDFDEKETCVYGANGTFKSSILDAFRWCLTGKDAQDRKDFDIKNTVNTELNRQDHEVSAFLTIDGRKENPKRILREKWVKKQGSDNREFIGNETVFFWNDVPMQAGEFSAKTTSAILPENVFKLLSDPLNFNSLKWSERRSILEEMAGTISDLDILDKMATQKNADQISHLSEVINTGKKLKDYQTQINSQKKTLKTSLDEITPRIDERFKSIPEALDFPEIEKKIDAENKKLGKIDQDILNRTQANQEKLSVIQKKQNDLHKLKSDQSALSFSVRSSIQDNDNTTRSGLNALKLKISIIEDDLTSKKTLIQSKRDIRISIETKMEELRKAWSLDKAREFKYDDSKFLCTTCNRDFETNDIEESKRLMRENFDTETARLTDLANEKGLRLKKEIEDNESIVSTLEKSILTLEKELEEANSEFNNKNIPSIDIDEMVSFQLKSHTEYQNLSKSISQIEADLLTSEKPVVNTEDLAESKAVIYAELDELKKQLNIRDQIESVNKRIQELKDEEKNLSQQLAKLEGIEFTIDEFTKSKINIIEERINGRFKYTTFKMFNYLINGGSEDTCVSMLKEVPWDVLNTAGRIWCGLDIIATLSDHYGFSMPNFLDNRESTTLIPSTDNQVINLFVSPADETLRIA